MPQHENLFPILQTLHPCISVSIKIIRWMCLVPASQPLKVGRQSQLRASSSFASSTMEQRQSITERCPHLHAPTPTSPYPPSPVHITTAPLLLCGAKWKLCPSSSSTTPSKRRRKQSCRNPRRNAMARSSACEVGTRPSAPSTVRGQLVFRRRVSRKLVFYELEVQEGEGASHGIELCIKASDGMIEERVKHCRDQLKLGDVVVVVGAMEENGRTLRVREVDVVQPWKEAHPHEHFLPKRILQHTENDDTDEKKEEVAGAGICKFFLNTGRCSAGETCKFLHTNDAVEKRAFIKQRMEAKVALSDNPHKDEAQSKRKRAKVFVDWLVDTFGSSRLSMGTGVLDVAGGRGNLAFELFTLRGIPCTTIDPREQKFTRRQRRTLAKNPDAARRGAPPYLQRLFGESLWEDEEHRALLRNCSACIGMHPDEATEAIVDFSILYSKPFAVVPCCVFPRLFPERVLHGKHVVTYDEFVKFLALKSGGSIGHLQIHGLSKVVYCLE